jgi:hypothetical protein
MLWRSNRRSWVRLSSLGALLLSRRRRPCTKCTLTNAERTDFPTFLSLSHRHRTGRGHPWCSCQGVSLDRRHRCASFFLPRSSSSTRLRPRLDLTARSSSDFSPIQQLFDVNEAFAAQWLSVQKELGLPNEKTNVFGGAIGSSSFSFRRPRPALFSNAQLTVPLLFLQPLVTLWLLRTPLLPLLRLKTSKLTFSCFPSFRQLRPLPHFPSLRLHTAVLASPTTSYTTSTASTSATPSVLLASEEDRCVFLRRLHPLSAFLLDETDS